MTRKLLNHLSQKLDHVKNVDKYFSHQQNTFKFDIQIQFEFKTFPIFQLMTSITWIIGIFRIYLFIAFNIANIEIFHLEISFADRYYIIPQQIQILLLVFWVGTILLVVKVLKDNRRL